MSRSPCATSVHGGKARASWRELPNAGPPPADVYATRSAMTSTVSASGPSPGFVRADARCRPVAEFELR
eukprot:CAMPEP_0119475188 /NCGR_PEP_ID=MMETSP1344-20130328/6168_1 /TAXON_ID=236787 /ORGANISM="Florenciella parvula, Strain CCMP2471" /LENGTH=68 /DNA_ID=CAMNT_0007508649 /DNA_START=124 /DNA_END=330 /DNA_ORIENTATION=+